MYIPFSDESNLSALVKAQLQSLMEQSSADVVAVASAAGDISTIRSFLKDNPDKVHVYRQMHDGMYMYVHVFHACVYR